MDSSFDMSNDDERVEPKVPFGFHCVSRNKAHPLAACDWLYEEEEDEESLLDKQVAEAVAHAISLWLLFVFRTSCYYTSRPEVTYKNDSFRLCLKKLYEEDEMVDYEEPNYESSWDLPEEEADEFFRHDYGTMMFDEMVDYEEPNYESYCDEPEKEADIFFREVKEAIRQYEETGYWPPDFNELGFTWDEPEEPYEPEVQEIFTFRWRSLSETSRNRCGTPHWRRRKGGRLIGSRSEGDKFSNARHVPIQQTTAVLVDDHVYQLGRRFF